MLPKVFDVAIIGSGPGGYVAAIKAAQLGFKTALIEKYDSVGGTCLNVGCIPSKALLHSSHLVYEAKNNFKSNGINIEGLTVDFDTMMANKQDAVSKLVGGIEFLIGKNKIELFTGVGSFEDANTINVVGKNEAKIESKNIIIATGSKPTAVPGMDFDDNIICSSTDALSFKEIPKSLAVIGAGVIGLELGSVYSRLGTDVTVIQSRDTVGSGLDPDIAKSFGRILKKQGLTIKTNQRVLEGKVNPDGSGATLELESKGKKSQVVADKVLVSIGRHAYTDGLGLENIKVSTDDRGQIPVNPETFQVGDYKHIFAIGDVIDQGPMLAHKASDEGVFVCEQIAGIKGLVDYNSTPAVIYTEPECSQVGLTAAQAIEKGYEVKESSFPFSANSRAKAYHNTDGLVKLIADKKTDQLLGCHILGPTAGELIQEAACIIAFKGSTEDIARISHGHPGFGEAVREAAWAAFTGKAIHS